ncbi:hypothetical protein EWM64_g3958 [Hericium alpestre]|uniref:Uncharacterized protein n=1 Tax=Hericium alpestre TaxID=135208 RepID=A0A4Z0A0U5_9AGAM|nr:hypothetical protein EWM64_g3958 [Hericium alpestre]
MVRRRRQAARRSRAQNLALCLDSKDKLVATLSALCEELIWSMHEFPCQSVGAAGCRGISSAGMHYFEAFFKDLTEPCFGLPFRLANADPEFEELCEACWERLEDIESTLRRRLWNALPSHCGFKDWEAVKTAQTALDADIIVGSP